ESEEYYAGQTWDSEPSGFLLKQDLTHEEAEDLVREYITENIRNSIEHEWREDWQISVFYQHPEKSQIYPQFDTLAIKRFVTKEIEEKKQKEKETKEREARELQDRIEKQTYLRLKEKFEK